LHFDVPSERGDIKVVRCVYLYTQIASSERDGESADNESGFGLALVPVDGEREEEGEGREKSMEKAKVYRRVGHVQGLLLRCFRGVEGDDIVVV
jgi:hypothetical protein